MKIDFRETNKNTIPIDKINDNNIVIAYNNTNNAISSIPMVLLKEELVGTSRYIYIWRTMKGVYIEKGKSIKEAILNLKKEYSDYEFEVY